MALLRLLRSSSMHAHEELQLNVVSAITNLTYYVVDDSHLLHSHEELCAALIAGQSPTFHSPRRATASRESIHLWRPAQAAAAARRRVRVAGTLAVPNTSGHFNYY